MPDQNEQLAELIKKFRALKTHEEKCAFLHQPENYPILGTIYNSIHFPKPAEKPTTE
jgi:hypothetical protein